MSWNSKGSYRTTQENMMKAFDKLPRDVRMALAESPFNWAPQPLLTQWKRGVHGSELVKRIRRWNSERIAKDAKKLAKVK